LRGRRTDALGASPYLWDGALRKADVEELRRRIVDFDYMINNFYRLRDLGDKGFPRRARLEKLGLSDMADALEKV